MFTETSNVLIIWTISPHECVKVWHAHLVLLVHVLLHFLLWEKYKLNYRWVNAVCYWYRKIPIQEMTVVLVIEFGKYQLEIKKVSSQIQIISKTVNRPKSLYALTGYGVIMTFNNIHFKLLYLSPHCEGDMNIWHACDKHCSLTL